ncbi:MAG: hypothetical protein JWM21_1882 [Acidobacteria bacterium]|nr:hypothetical protein [Acidobacteriota bacterium]
MSDRSRGAYRSPGKLKPATKTFFVRVGDSIRLCTRQKIDTASNVAYCARVQPGYFKNWSSEPAIAAFLP